MLHAAAPVPIEAAIIGHAPDAEQSIIKRSFQPDVAHGMCLATSLDAGALADLHPVRPRSRIDEATPQLMDEEAVTHAADECIGGVCASGEVEVGHARQRWVGVRGPSPVARPRQVQLIRVCPVRKPLQAVPVADERRLARCGPFVIVRGGGPPVGMCTVIEKRDVRWGDLASERERAFGGRNISFQVVPDALVQPCAAPSCSEYDGVAACSERSRIRQALRLGNGVSCAARRYIVIKGIR